MEISQSTFNETYQFVFLPAWAKLLFTYFVKYLLELTYSYWNIVQETMKFFGTCLKVVDNVDRIVQLVTLNNMLYVNEGRFPMS